MGLKTANRTVAVTLPSVWAGLNRGFGDTSGRRFRVCAEDLLISVVVLLMEPIPYSSIGRAFDC